MFLPRGLFSLHGLGDVSFHVSHKIPFEKYKCITEIIVIIVRQQRYEIIVDGSFDHWENIEEILEFTLRSLTFNCRL